MVCCITYRSKVKKYENKLNILYEREINDAPFMCSNQSPDYFYLKNKKSPSARNSNLSSESCIFNS